MHIYRDFRALCIPSNLKEKSITLRKELKPWREEVRRCQRPMLSGIKSRRKGTLFESGCMGTPPPCFSIRPPPRPLGVPLAGTASPIQVRQFPEAGSPLAEVIVIMVSIRGDRAQRAERLGHGAAALVGVRGQ